MYIVIIGDVLSGFNFVGPFKSLSSAENFVGSDKDVIVKLSYPPTEFLPDCIVED